MAEKSYSIVFGDTAAEEKKILHRSETADSLSRSTVFSFGKSSALVRNQAIAPEITFLEILKDGLNNPYVQINWRIKKSDVDSGKILGFNVFRIKISGKQAQGIKGVSAFDRNAFDRLSIKNKKTGNFSEEKKAISNVKTGLIDKSTLNHSLYLEQSRAKSLSQRGVKLLVNDSFDSSDNTFESSDNIYEFHKIGRVDYSSFLAQQKNRTVFVQNRDFSDIFFRDRNVGFMETFGYYVETITKELEKPSKSDVVYLTINNNRHPVPIKQIVIKQSKPTQITAAITLSDDLYASKVLIQKRSENDADFEFLPDIFAITQAVKFVDDDIIAGIVYFYRFFVEDIFGKISIPIQVVSIERGQETNDQKVIVQKATTEIKSNTFNTPAFSVLQDDNSAFIKITISPNDSLISHYVLDRQDLTIKEKAFRVPSKVYTNYGGDGWATNQFFVEKNIVIDSSLKTGILAKVTFKEINFIDTTVNQNHIYRYRIRGYDVAGNGTNYAFSYIATKGKKNLRFPINFKIETLRKHPLRVRLSWDDDNSFLSNELKSNISFKIERKSVSGKAYESFPLTKDNFIIDEVASLDAVGFDNSGLSRFGDEISGETELLGASAIRRSFGFPAFLQNHARYLYKVSAVSQDGQSDSNPSPEFEFWALADVATPIDFVAEVVNTKVKPTTVQLSWKNEPNKPVPDSWQIERKVDTTNDSFQLIGSTYLENEFLDFNVRPGLTYIYRVKGFSAFKHESDFAETKVVV